MTKFEKFAFASIFILVGIGTVMANLLEGARFTEHWMVREDGVYEWLTVISLLSVTVLCLARARKLRRQRPALFTACTIGLGLVFLFGAGEEISWGQRILNIESSEFFLENNAQSETNLHNLVVGEHKINKVVFSKLLGLAMILYLLILPPLHAKIESIRSLATAFAVPVARLHHIVAILAVFGLVSLAPSSKKGEISEFGSTALIFLLVLNPKNKERFEIEDKTA